MSEMNCACEARLGAAHEIREALFREHAIDASRRSPLEHPLGLAILTVKPGVAERAIHVDVCDKLPSREQAEEEQKRMQKFLRKRCARQFMCRALRILRKDRGLAISGSSAAGVSGNRWPIPARRGRRYPDIGQFATAS
jgi:hypothetical protein